jgi:tRNA threonylcarbamoyladenosine biosynthesis protein TsaE
MHSHDPEGLTSFALISESAEATEAVAASLAPLFAPGDVVLLRGEMGAGKTTFVRGLHRALGCGGRTRSPSFTTLNVYPGEPPLHHFDLFRYDAVGPAFFDEFAPWLEGDGIAVIEWPERMGGYIPDIHLDVELRGSGTERSITFSAHGEGWAERMSEWRRTRTGSEPDA